MASLRANEAEASRAYLSYSHTRNGTPSYCAIAVTVKNKTGQTLYIDLGNTFFIRNMSPSPYYVPSATQTTTSTTTGASINMGAVAGALGVGGRAGTLASGVNCRWGKHKQYKRHYIYTACYTRSCTFFQDT